MVSRTVLPNSGSSPAGEGKQYNSGNREQRVSDPTEQGPRANAADDDQERHSATDQMEEQQETDS